MIIIPFITRAGRVGRGFLGEEVPARQVGLGLVFQQWLCWGRVPGDVFVPLVRTGLLRALRLDSHQHLHRPMLEGRCPLLLPLHHAPVSQEVGVTYTGARGEGHRVHLQNCESCSRSGAGKPGARG